jgi:hypothetical protein
MDDKWEIIKDLGPAAFLLQKMDAHIHLRDRRMVQL